MSPGLSDVTNNLAVGYFLAEVLYSSENASLVDWRQVTKPVPDILYTVQCTLYTVIGAVDFCSFFLLLFNM